MSAAIVGGAVAACGLAACGSSPSDEEQIRQAVAQAQESFDSDDLRGVCDSLTDAGRRHVMSVGHRSSGSCPRDLETVQGLIWQDRDRPKAATHRVLRIRVRGDAATAVVDYGGGSRGDVPLAKEDGDWKIDGLYGGLPAQRQTDKY